MARIYTFWLELSTEQCLDFYQGLIRYVLVQADSGEKVQLKIEHFRPFITHHGVRGRFRLQITPQGQFIALHKIN